MIDQDISILTILILLSWDYGFSNFNQVSTSL